VVGGDSIRSDVLAEANTIARRFGPVGAIRRWPPVWISHLRATLIGVLGSGSRQVQCGGGFLFTRQQTRIRITA